MPGVPLIGVSAELFADPVRVLVPFAYPERVVEIDTVALWLEESPETVIGKVLPEGVPAVAVPEVEDIENV